MTTETWTIIVSLLAVGFALYALIKAREAGTPITGALIEGTLQTAEASATHVATIVKAGVFAAEQLKATGKLPDNNAAFNYAYDFAHKLLPDLDKATITTFIESMVPLANKIYESTRPVAPRVSSDL